MTEPIAPVRLSVHVPLTPEEAFHHFTERIGEWWPLATHSVVQGRAVACGIEPRAGGSVWEATAAGERFVWGTILVWDPPGRLAFTWHPGRDASTAQEVEVRFSAVDGGTSVELEHRGWEALGAEAVRTREQYVNGWKLVFGTRYAESAAGAASRGTR